MARPAYDVVASLGKYEDKNGTQRTRKRAVGIIYINEADGKMFLALDALFNPAALERKYGSDKVMLSLVPVDERN